MTRFLVSLFLLFSIVILKEALAVQDTFFMKQQLAVTATTSSTLALAQNSNRKYLLIQNNGTSNVIVKLASVQSASEGTIILPGGNWEPQKAPTDSIYLKSASSTDACTIIEGQ